MGYSRGGGNWGTSRIPREDWGTLGTFGEDKGHHHPPPKNPMNLGPWHFVLLQVFPAVCGIRCFEQREQHPDGSSGVVGAGEGGKKKSTCKFAAGTRSWSLFLICLHHGNPRFLHF